MSHGYEYAREEHVLLDEADFEKLPLPSRRTIQLSAFVPLRKIDPIYWERSYYLGPEETGLRPFVLLLQALKKKRVVALAKIAIRNKEQLCCLRPYNGTLILETMFYPDEIREVGGQGRRRVKVGAREMEMAFALIDLLSEPFDPAGFRDGYRQALMEIIEAKLQGQEIVATPPVPARAPDLMAALKASVEAEAARKRREAQAGAKAFRGRREKAAV